MGNDKVSSDVFFASLVFSGSKPVYVVGSVVDALFLSPGAVARWSRRWVRDSQSAPIKCMLQS